MLPFFYAPHLTDTSKGLELDEATSRHCVQVLRMQAGAGLHLTNGTGGRALAAIETAHKKYAQVHIREFTVEPVALPATAIAISLLKNTGRFEWLLEKATELGITEIIPLICHRTEKQHFRYGRMQQILISAMLQSQQTWLPVLQQPVAFEQYVTGCGHTQKYIAHCMEGEKPLLHAALRNGGSRICCIGPEGDFTPDEVNRALESGFTAVSLGQTRLRTETAGMVAAVSLKILHAKH